VSSGGGIDADKVEILETALDQLASEAPRRALVLATLCGELSYGSTLERRQALADEAIAIARSSGDDATIARVLNTISFALLVPPLLEQSLAWTADALQRAERVGDPVLVFWAAQTRANVASCAGDIDEMHRCYDTVGSLAEQLDQPLFNWIHAFNCALRAQFAGDIEQAEQLATKALAIGTDGGQPDANLFYGLHASAVSFDRGTLGETVPLLEQISADIPDLASGLASFLAVAHVEAGRLDDARRLLESFAATNFDHPIDTGWLGAMTQYADVAIAGRDTRYAAPLFAQLAPYPDRVVCTGVSVGASVSYHLGGLATVLGRYDEAYFAKAAAFNDRASAKAHAARTSLSWGKMLAERNAPGDTQRARALLTKAHAAAAAHGYAAVERRAAYALQHPD
jgi:tetratricopeptide (TPR) repeat protein